MNAIIALLEFFAACTVAMPGAAIVIYLAEKKNTRLGVWLNQLFDLDN